MLRNKGRSTLAIGLVGMLGWGGVIGLLPGVVGAQLVPDTTLGAESSIVAPLSPTIDVIGSGAPRGINLFHSFREFNVGAGRGAYFLVPNTVIQNVFARVTGTSRSAISGVLGIRNLIGGAILPSSANLFLINPNGIVFGAGASLDVGGSFVATTANAIQLGVNGLFSASAPATSNLLSVNPSAFLFNAIANQNEPEIVVRSNAINPLGGRGLQVPNGHNLLLVGGNVRLEGGIVQARGGRVELSGLAGGGGINLTPTQNFFLLNIPIGASFSNVTLTSSSSNPLAPSGINVAGGSITINANHLDILGGSVLAGSIFGELGTAPPQSGNIVLNVNGATRIEGAGGGVFNTVEVGATGKAGNIVVTTTSLLVTNGAALNSSTFGKGSAGDISITVHDVATFDGVGSNGSSSFVGGQVGPDAVGKGGNLTLSAGSLNVTNGATLNSSTFGRGNAGDVLITVRDVATFDRGGSVGGQVGLDAVGKGGNLTLSAGSLNVTNGATLNSSTFGRGNAGDVLITVRDVTTFDGVSRNGFPSVAGSEVGPNAVGKGGNLTLSTGSLRVINGAALSSSTFGQGNAGDVSIMVRDVATFDGVGRSGFPSSARSIVGLNAVGKGGNLILSAASLGVTNGATLNSSTFGQGDAGDISITVRDAATFDGVASSTFSSGAASEVGRNSIGKGGSLVLFASSLRVTNGAVLSSSTTGQGDAGDLLITVRGAATFDGVASNGFSSGAGSEVGRGAVGKGGSLVLFADSLRVTNGAVLSSSTAGQGEAGDLLITVRDAATFDGVASNGFSSSAKSQVEPNGVGRGGNLILFAGSLNLTNRAILSSVSLGQGNAGSIVLRIREQLRLADSSIGTASLQNSGGVIDTVAKSIRLLGSSNIFTNVLNGTGDGGNITLTANSILALNDSNILAFARNGRGGNIVLNTRAFFGQNYRPAPPGTDPFTLVGNRRVDVNASGAVSGAITLPDTTFIQNSLTQLPQVLINTNNLLANSCIVRRERSSGSFFITGSGGLPERPGEAQPPEFPTGEVRNVGEDRKVGGDREGLIDSSPSPSSPQAWKMGDSVIEPQGVYQLLDGELVLSNECSLVHKAGN